MDLARLSDEYVKELAHHHVPGRLKVAPEHVDPKVLAAMKKPAHDTFEDFADKFQKENDAAGKRQFIVPYFIASHPGSDLDAMITLAQYLKSHGYKPDQVQDFIPSPMDLAAAMYYTGKNPETGAPMPVAKGLRDRKLQRALLQFFKPENYFEVREALLKAGRKDLIGDGKDCLIGHRAPREALEARRREAEKALRMDRTPSHADEDHVHSREIFKDKPAGSAGYRPGRKSWKRR